MTWNFLTHLHAVRSARIGHGNSFEPSRQLRNIMNSFRQEWKNDLVDPIWNKNFEILDLVLEQLWHTSLTPRADLNGMKLNIRFFDEAESCRTNTNRPWNCFEMFSLTTKSWDLHSTGLKKNTGKRKFLFPRIVSDIRKLLPIPMWTISASFEYFSMISGAKNICDVSRF